MIFCILRYTIFSGFFQFLIPIIIITVIYLRILLFLKVKKHKVLKVYLYGNTLFFVLSMLLRLFAEESGFSAKLVGETEKDERHSFLNLSHLLCHMAPL